MLKCFIISLFVVVLTVDAQKRCNGGVECILLEQCYGLYADLQRGSNPGLTALLRSLHCGFEGRDKPKICCPPQYKDIRNGAESENSGGTGNTNRIGENTGGVNKFGGNSNFGANTNVGGSNNIGGNTNSRDLLPDNRVCGIQSNDRIVGGTQVDLDEFPWMALIRYDKPVGWGFYCGGVLISSRYVMTAAHCVKGADLPPRWRITQVRLGEWDTSTDRDCIQDDCSDPVVNVAVEELIPHEAYDSNNKNQHDDIALLRLARDVQFTDFVKPICLPRTSALRQSTFESFVMTVAGWGKTESRSESEVKLKVEVPIVSNRDCSNVFGRVGRRIVDRQLCAGGEAGKDSCRGDSGGSLMGRAPSSDNWIALGVVSYGPTPCGTPGWPGVYTRVGAYVDWIVSKLRP